MRALVVGGAGFIGSHLVDRLLADEATVDVVDDYSTGSLGNLASARALGANLQIHHLDAGSDETASLLQMKQPDVLYHLAAVPKSNASEAQAAAFAATLSLLAAARRQSIAKVVVALPATVLYGRPDTRDLPLKERPVEPRGLRGIIARSTIDVLQLHREQAAIEFTALALGTVYGPRQRAGNGVVATLFEAAQQQATPTIVGDGRQTRDFVFIDDAVDALVRSGEKGSGLVINIGTGEQTTINDIWEAVGGHGATNYVSPDAEFLGRFALSPIRARLHLGWAPWTSVAAGIAALDR